MDAHGVFGQDDQMLVFHQRCCHTLVLHALGDAFGQRFVDEPEVSKVARVECGEQHVGYDVDQGYEHRVFKLSGVEKTVYIASTCGT